MVRRDSYEFVEAIPGSEFMTEAEKMEAADLLQPGLDVVGPGAGREWYENNPDLQDFFDYMGLSDDSPIFWEAFRDWYGETG